MSTSVDLDRYRGDSRVRKLITENRAVVGVAALLVVLSLLAVGVNAAGFPAIAGMLVSWNVLVTGVLFVFAVLPLYAIRFLPSYHKF